MSIFTKTSRTKLPQNNFKDLSYSNKVDMQLGYLYPVHVEEIVPGDVFFSGHGAMVRSQPMVTPVFHNFNYNIRWFFVPNRIMWKDFESFIADQQKGKKNIGLPEPITHPYLSDNDNECGYLHDLIGVPPTLDIIGSQAFVTPKKYSEMGCPINALPFRAYYMIWNEYFKDENTMDDLEYSDESGADPTVYELQRVSWKKDYFTSALPFAQRGEAVQMIGRVILGDQSSPQVWRQSDGEMVSVLGDGIFANDAASNTVLQSEDSPNHETAWMDPNGTLNAAVEFSAIRRATALQRFLERSALSGNRYAELLLAHFGVRSSDQSLQRPQYLGGGVMPINISPVEQNSETGTTPQGTLAGKGVGVGSMYFSKRTMFTEHGWLLGLAFIRPDADYCLGMNRHLSKENRFDYYWPDFQNIGEQEILNRELFIQGLSSEGNLKTFGYQSRYAEYKWHGNEIHGEFRRSLRSWVAPREFTETPSLSKEFIECNLDISNNMAVAPSKFPPFMVEAMNVVHARRPMYYFNRGVL